MSVQVPQPGEQFAGKYRIEDHIGSGGFAEVFLASDASGARYAIKLLVPGQQEWQQSAGEKLIERFEREGKLLGRLTNEHTVKMIEMGRNPQGLPFIVFEYIDGIDLADLVHEHGPLPPERVVTILKQVCSALAEAHDLGVMHRDIKPANIMVYQHLGIQGLVKLLDFGIAKPQATGDGASTGATLTTAGMVLGTPRYMAPEQFTGAKLAPTSDIYSLGLVAYELLVGEPAVDAESTTGIFRQQLSPDEFKFPRSARVPGSLRRIIGKMTRKSRKARYQNVRDVLTDLQAWEPSRDASSQGVQIAALLAVLGIGGLLGFYFLSGKANQQQASTRPGATQQAGDEKTTNESPPDPTAVTSIGDERADAARPVDMAETKESDRKEAERRPADDTKPESDEPTEVVEAKNPPPDDIEPLELETEAEAKAVASSAYTMADWERVIAACKPYGAESTFCGKMLAEAYKNRGDFGRACKWFEAIGDHKHGIDCSKYDDGG